MQQTINHQEKNGFILNQNPVPPSYTLIFEDDRHALPTGLSQMVTLKSVDEAELLLRLLGDSCEIYISEEFRQARPELDVTVVRLSRIGISKLAPFDSDIAASLMRKLPLDLKSLINTPLALMAGDQMPGPIDRRMVHKNNDSNVLISTPFTTGWLIHFNMFQETHELNFDHASAHVQGMLMLEAMRQASIATAHLQGLPLDGMLALMSYSTNFLNFLERNQPIILRAYTCFHADETSEDKECDIFIQVMQWGRICAEAKLKAFACMSSLSCRQKEARIQKIAFRHKTNYEMKLNRVREMEAEC
jgi:hypothetical protein